MKTLISKISAISVIVCLFLCCAMQVDARNDRDEEDMFPHEGKLGKGGLRSNEIVVSIESAGDNVILQFHKKLGNVEIAILTEAGRLVYFDYINNPQMEVVSLSGVRKGNYYVEVYANKRTYYDYVYIE